MSNVTRVGIFGVSHIQVPVLELERASRFYEEGLGFARRESGEGWTDFDASATLIRLSQVTSGSGDYHVALRIQVAEVEPVYRALLAAGGRALCDPMRTAEHEELAALGDGEGNTISLWRPLSEDEYGFLPELPTETSWDPEAEALLKSLLLAVPTLFRSLARRKVVRLAEQLYPRQVIGRLEVVRAYILASARITRHRLRDPLRRHGFLPEDFQAEFEAE
jgi:predicted enzyme related to lactoylglutathione lyase